MHRFYPIFGRKSSKINQQKTTVPIPLVAFCMSQCPFKTIPRPIRYNRKNVHNKPPLPKKIFDPLTHTILAHNIYQG